jgi:hypothetical protein
MPADFLEVDCCDVRAVVRDAIKPGPEADVAHAAAVVAARLK